MHIGDNVANSGVAPGVILILAPMAYKNESLFMTIMKTSGNWVHYYDSLMIDRNKRICSLKKGIRSQDSLRVHPT